MRIMLADLLATDWTSLTHAYGTAEDVPQILRRLASQDPNTREALIRSRR